MKNKTPMTNEDFLEMSRELAEAIVENRMGLHAMWHYWGDKKYLGLTDEAKDLFNETLDIIQARLLNDIEITNQ
jgi:hypothetical protein